MQRRSGKNKKGFTRKRDWVQRLERRSVIGKQIPSIINYHRIQGIVVDTRYMLYHYIGSSQKNKEALAECIEKVKNRDPVPPPN